MLDSQKNCEDTTENSYKTTADVNVPNAIVLHCHGVVVKSKRATVGQYS